MVVVIISSHEYDVNIITFCRPDTRVFYFYVQREGHHFAAPLLISRCEELCDNCTALKVCPYMRIFPLLNRFICSLNIMRVYITENRYKHFVQLVLCTTCMNGNF